MSSEVLHIAFNRKAEEFEDAYRHLYEENKTLMSFMRDAGMPVPKGFMAAAEFNLVAQIKKEFLKRELDRRQDQGDRQGGRANGT